MQIRRSRIGFRAEPCAFFRNVRGENDTSCCVHASTLLPTTDTNPISFPDRSTLRGNETKRNTGATHLVNKSFSDECTCQSLTSLRLSVLTLYWQDDV